MDVSELERLISLMKSATISELTLREGSTRVTLRKRRTAPSGAMVVYTGNGEGFVSEEEPGEGFESAPAEDVVVIAPLVGVFRHLKPMVGLGARVKEGQKIGSIQAVKLMNDLICPADGVISDVLIEDGHAVEYGHVLFTIKPDLALAERNSE